MKKRVIIFCMEKVLFNNNCHTGLDVPKIFHIIRFAICDLRFAICDLRFAIRPNLSYFLKSITQKISSLVKTGPHGFASFEA